MNKPQVTKRVKIFQASLLDFVNLENLKADIGEKLLGSREIIESVFGKFKEIEKEPSKSGLTGLLLILAAMVSKTTIDTVFKALESVKVQDILDWCEQNIGESVQSLKKKFINGCKRKKFPEGDKKKEQKRGKLII